MFYNKLNSGKNFVFKRTLNLLIETKSSRVGQRQIRPIVLT
ncbi:hypothetical protein LEP1GSC067_3915 [Leptospira interrogans serovar Lora str. TE 1992]|uniref:Uncharacterized protein n=2 Tax=Leptospira interrogans TaxID=173 RepID=M6HJ22_LEPIR|nr:hypothetical protein LEP1GSC019_2904 [Leptospira interrogans serovar Pyrogenes str. 2006006960]EMF44231.1 hypothetical protein LEP1GSC067_3915 [Leptospira interrogans serovar Lora str. TE 1992]EMM95357.1 hypothetical protein LEP1GSC158_0776 [Leptospira interrogans serovar Zanoni str. LT2156]EMN10142.1 hypothetical protein LEP1GSC053_3896 [Leptospira interrogans serovar Muenchen str. Brem 129]